MFLCKIWAPLLTSPVKVRLMCSDSSKFVRVDYIPKSAASMIYREINTTGRFDMAYIQNWNYDQSTKK